MRPLVVDGEVMIEKGRSTRVDEEEVHAQCVREAKVLWGKNGIEV